MTVASPIADDHRSRVARSRRERTRARLIEAATLVFAERGPEATLIDHVIRAAGVSRGTFYNYFQTTDELMQAAKSALATEMIGFAVGASDASIGPAERLADGFKAIFDLAERHPLVLDFIARLGMSDVGSGQLVPAATLDDLTKVIAAGRAHPLSADLALDIIEASTIAALRRLVEGQPVDVTAFVAAVLRLLGRPDDDAARLAERAFTRFDVPPDSLIARVEAARAGAGS